MAGLALFALGLVLMGGVLTPALMVLRRIGWLYWWTTLPFAAATTALPLTVLCALPGGICQASGFDALVGALLLAGLSGGLSLWWSWLRHQASEPTIAQRLAVQSPAMKLGLIFVSCYVAVLAAAVIFVATSSGDMSGVVFLYIAQPWPLVGFRLLGLSGTGAGMLLGLPLNGVIVFGIGCGLSYAFRRNKAPTGRG
jgi:hypothetical protein